MRKSVPKKKTREDILDSSMPLFARRGYEGVSMRDVANSVGLTQAALYYHFSDKDQLYLDGMSNEFRKKAATLRNIIDCGGSPWERLRGFVTGLAKLIATDRDFLRLMQWVQLDSDEARQRTLAEHVFKDLFSAVYDLASQLDPQRDAYQTGISIIGLVMFHFEIGATRMLMPGYCAAQDTPEALAQYVYDLLFAAFGTSPAEAS